MLQGLIVFDQHSRTLDRLTVCKNVSYVI